MSAISTAQEKPASKNAASSVGMSSMEKKILSTLGALVVIALVFSFLTDGLFLESRNISNLLRQTAINGVLAVGMTYVILLGGVDLSVGSVTAAIGILIAISQTSWGWGAAGSLGFVATLAVALAMGLGIGFFNAFWISGLGIHSFVITFGMMVIARGLALIMSNGSGISPMGETLRVLGEGYLGNAAAAVILFGAAAAWIAYTIIDENRGRSQRAGQPTWRVALKVAFIGGGLTTLYLLCSSYQGLPVPVLVFGLVAFAGAWVLGRTRFGRYVYAVGGNMEAARLAGIPVKKVVFSVFTMMSMLAALAGLILTARLNGATPTAGNLFELDAIAAVVIGGTSLRGGKGSVVGSIIGALIIESLNNGMTLLNVDSFYQMPLKGAIVIMAVALDSILENRRD